MDKVGISVSKWGRVLTWIPVVAAAVMPLWFLHLEKELRIFRKQALSYKRFMEASFDAPEGAFSLMPTPLKNIPFGEKTHLVLGAKALEIRGVCNPYNASIVKKASGGYLLFFRYDLIEEDVAGGLTAYMGCAELDAEFNQTEKEFIAINAHSKHAEDPRALYLNGKLHLVYNDLISDQYADRRVMHKAELDLENYQLKNVVQLDPHLQMLEKNWVPFEYDADLYFDYALTPLKILKTSDDPANPLIHLPSSYNRNLDGLLWPSMWGSLRGGTPAQKVGNEYLAFFHSSFRDKNNVVWYCMGAYTFEPHPPFRITGLSSYPILFNEIYGTPPMNTADPMKRVIFPAGFVVEEREGRDVIQISCGENDAGVKIVTLDKEKLLKGLKKIKVTRDAN